MKLTEKNKHFIINNRETLRELFLSRIEELKDLVADEIPNEKTNSRILLIHEFKAWLKEMEILVNPEKPSKNNLI